MRDRCPNAVRTLPISHTRRYRRDSHMIEALTMPAILLALAISGALALYGIIRQ